MEDLISIVNRLQDTFSVIGSESVDLPQIVVVGSQSSGKSSVLETIVGRDFLPRGSGIVTRRPLVLQLINSPAPTQDLAASTYEDALDDMPSHSRAQTHPLRRPLPRTSGRDSPSIRTANGEENGTPYGLGSMYPLTEWGEFLHIPNRRYEYADIKREIEAETFRVAGQNKGISKLPIHLKIHSPHVLNLTLVDLPGLTKIPVGDQPSDIEKQIRTLVTDYISRPNSVILAISPANVDLANSDSLKLARQVDPRGRRTIGVLTKLDLMDNGTNALDILTGRVYPLKLGFVGVVNRSQGDIISGKSLSHSIDDEKEFFRNHPAYRSISHRCGISYLAKTLNHVLLAHIREKLPDIKARLNTLMGQTQQELNTYGDATFLGESHRGSLVLKLMTQFARDFVANIDGTSYDISTKELSGGARIYYIFTDVFGTALDTINPIANLSTMDIRTAIRNSTGPRPSLFVPENAFDLLIKPQIKLLEAPSQRCVELVYEELMKICHNCTSNELQRFPRLHAKLIEVVSDLLRERLGPTAEYVESLIAIQQAYINTNHPAFVNGAGTPNMETKRTERRSRGESRRMMVGNGAPPEISEPPEEQESQSYGDQGTPSPDERASALIHGAVSRSRKISGVVQTRHPQYPGSPNLSHQPHTQELSSTPSSHQVSGATPAASSARDQFLNYFFGNSTTATKPDGLLPELEAVGNKKRESLDMKSLEKHLELIPADMDGHLTEREEMETSLIRSLISSYFDITRQSIADLVPKAVMHLLVNFSRESVQNRLVTQLYDETLFRDLLAEDEHVAAERQKLKSLYEAYKQAFLAISSF